MTRSIELLAAGAFVAAMSAFAPAQAATVMQQCGQQYQAAKAAGTLAGMSWAQFRADCAAKLKAQPAAAAAPATAPATPVVVAPAAPVVNPVKPDTATVVPVAPAAPAATVAAPAKAPATGGRAAMLVRERQCGAEWKAQKVTLVAQTPGLTWPKYWSQCNTRLKAAGQ